MIGHRLLAALVLCQAALGARVALRLAWTAGGERVRAVPDGFPIGESVSVIVPVLNEVDRLGPCLEGLIVQTAEVDEILVVDGGSTDGTHQIVRAYAARDARLRLIDASPVPPDWNGKAWGLQVGLSQVTPAAAWVLMIDADVRPEPALVRSLVAHADRTSLASLSVATLQELERADEALLHPSFLTTLIYRFGIPGHASRRVTEVQANGQCFLVRRELLTEIGGFAGVRASRCEDVTLARALVAAGHAVGFFEADALVTCRMYADSREIWRNWPRSLPLWDRYYRLAALVGLAEVTLVQALPLFLLLILRQAGAARWMLAVNLILVAMRLGVLGGAARAYRRRPWTYWLSPLCDLPAAVEIWRSLVRRRHVWRGRHLVLGG